MFDRIEFLLSEALSALRRNLLMVVAAITTVAASLFLLGGLAYVYLRADAYAQEMSGRFEMRVFLADGTSFADIRKTAAAIRVIPGVKEVNWIPRDKAWAREQSLRPELTKGLENPFPDAFRVRIGDLSQSSAIVAAIRSQPAVLKEDGIQYLEQEQEFLRQILGILRWVGLALGGLLFVTAGLLIYNAIRATIFARRTELRIMQLVGATRTTITIPFLIEGFVQGALGGALASVLIYACNHTVARRFPDALVPAFDVWPWLGVLATIGAAYGWLCSWAAVFGQMRMR